MKRAIKKYKGLAKKELTVAFTSVRRNLDRLSRKVSAEAEAFMELEEDPSPAIAKRFERYDKELDALQLELDAIGMLKTGRFN